MSQCSVCSVLNVRSFENRTIHTKKLFLIHYYSSELALFASITPAEFKKLLPSNGALQVNYYENKQIAKFDTTLE